MATSSSPLAVRIDDDPGHQRIAGPSSSPTPVLRACMLCRSMKVKCVGGENPPCEKCRRNRVDCIPQAGPGRSGVRRPKVHPRPPPFFQATSPNRGSPATLRQLSSGSEDDDRATTFPTASPTSHEARKRDGQPGYPSQASLNDSGNDTPISKQDMQDMLQIFYSKLLPFVPALSSAFRQNPDHLINHELPFVHCICFVTAIFLPGGQAIRDLLVRPILQLMKAYPANENSIEKGVSAFAGLLVLSAYTDISHASSEKSEDISYWSLKNCIDMHAARLKLHNSVQALRLDIQKGIAISTSLSYRTYCLWLQAFVISHHRSIICGSPPSIRIDNTIRAGPELLTKIKPQSRLAAEVELCLIWDKVNTHKHQTGEWWCLPDLSEALDGDGTRAMLDSADVAINRWYDKWRECMEDTIGGNFLNFLGRYTRFAIRAYTIRGLTKSPREISARKRDELRRCVYAATRALDWPLGLSPLEKDKIRYVSDNFISQVTSCCLFILASFEAFGSAIPHVMDCLENTVTPSARLMIDLAINTDFEGHVQAMRILEKVDVLRESLETGERQVAEMDLDDLDDRLREEVPGAPFWDFSSEFDIA